MPIFAFIHLRSFPWWEFRHGISFNRSELSIAKNTLSLLSFRDVVRDVYHNIMPAYQTYVLQSGKEEEEKKKMQTMMMMNKTLNWEKI